MSKNIFDLVFEFYFVDIMISMNEAVIYTQHLNQTVTVKIDRPLGSTHPKHGFSYEVNYGFVPDTKAPDGEEIDAYVLGVDQPLQDFVGRCVAVVHRLNDNDDKLVVVPEGKEISDEEIKRLTNFQEKFFESVILRESGGRGERPL